MAEQAFEQLKQLGLATVDNIVKWMNEAKLIEKAHKTEQDVHKMFEGVADKNAVMVEDFKKVLETLAKEANVTGEQAVQMLTGVSDQLTELLQGVIATASKAVTSTK